MDKPEETQSKPIRVEEAVHLVPVFQKDLAAVYRLIAERNPELGTVGSIVTGGVDSEPVWSEEDLQALFRRCKHVHRAILERMARAGAQNKAVTYEELRVAGAAESNNPTFDFDNMRGNLAWISKYMLKVKGSTDGLYSFLDKGAGLPTGQRYEYRMSKATADTWLTIARRAVSAFDEIPAAE